MDLLPSQEFCSGEIFKVLVVCDNVNQSWRPFKVVSLTLEHFKDSQEFFIMNIIIQFCRVESLGVESNQMNLIIRWSINRSALVLQAIARAYEGLQGSKWLVMDPCKPL